jgi:hypothetical protein
MHTPKRSGIARGYLVLKMWFVSEDFCAVETADGEGLGEGCFGDEAVVDSPWFEEASCVGC